MLENMNTLFSVYSYYMTWFIDIEGDIFQLPAAAIWGH